MKEYDVLVEDLDEVGEEMKEEDESSDLAIEWLSGLAQGFITMIWRSRFAFREKMKAVKNFRHVAFDWKAY